MAPPSSYTFHVSATRRYAAVNNVSQHATRRPRNRQAVSLRSQVRIVASRLRSYLTQRPARGRAPRRPVVALTERMSGGPTICSRSRHTASRGRAARPAHGRQPRPVGERSLGPILPTCHHVRTSHFGVVMSPCPHRVPVWPLPLCWRWSNASQQ